MTESPQVTSEETTLLEALELMQRRHIRRLPVLRGHTLCGIISLSDLYRYVDPGHINRALLPQTATEHLEKHRVKEVMAAGPITCAPNTPLEEAGRLMRDRKVGALPVVQFGELMGIITESDVLTPLSSIASGGENSRRVCLRIPDNFQQYIFGDIVMVVRKAYIWNTPRLAHVVRPISVPIR
ncbi:MAG: CBS domain-containing protein [Thermodesulfobacteriota bacterium]